MPAKKMRQIKRAVTKATRSAKVSAFRASRAAGDSGAQTRRKVTVAEQRARRATINKYR